MLTDEPLLPPAPDEPAVAAVPPAAMGPCETGHRMEVGHSDSLVWVSGEVDTHTADQTLLFVTGLEDQFGV